MDEQFAAAKQGLARLTEARLLSDAESQLLISEADRLRSEIYANPLVDSRVTCYDMAAIVPARQSLERLNQRLPLLKRLAAVTEIKRLLEAPE